MHPFHKFLLAGIGIAAAFLIGWPVGVGLGSYLDGQGALARAEARGIPKFDGPPSPDQN